MIISGYTDAEDIIRAINEAGIYQYIIKPWQPESLILTLKNAVRLFELQRQNELLAVELKISAERAEKRRRDAQARAEPALSARRRHRARRRQPDERRCATALRRIAPYDVSVLITGESGTGKELVARALHYNSLRWDKPFVVENCAAMPNELLESELFGHKRGAFTGAVEDHVGLFERADGGTVFLDEIGEMSPAFQVKLLRVLQEGEIRPVGRRQTRKVDIRVIAATNKDLETEVRAGRFREDLYYRLSTVTIHIPALRDRRVDIPVLARMLLEKAQKQLGKRVKGLFRARPSPASRPTTGRATCANCRTRSSRLLVMAAGERRGRRRHPVAPHPAGRADRTRRQDVDLDRLPGRNAEERVESVEARIIRETSSATAGTRAGPPRSWGCRASGFAASSSATAWRRSKGLMPKGAGRSSPELTEKRRRRARSPSASMRRDAGPASFEAVGSCPPSAIP